MTATDELRRLLDERGVEWSEPVQMESSVYTRWYDSNHVQWTASEVHGTSKLRIGGMSITPEQAIEATLGPETCHEAMIDKFFRGCSECGYMWEYMYGVGKRVRPNYCPSCGRKVVVE